MLDPAAETKWMLLLGIPVIAGLLALAWRRSRSLAARIRAVREEMARHPQDPYSALASLMNQDEPKHAGRAQWPKE